MSVPIDFWEAPNLQVVRQALEAGHRIVLSTHLLPDGDGLGAEVAFFHYLKRAGKSCRVFNPDPLPPRYRFLDPTGALFPTALTTERETATDWSEWDLWVILDTNDPRRLGQLWNDYSSRSRSILFLDHHPEIESSTKVDYPSHAMLICQPGCSSIAELLYRLFVHLNWHPIDSHVALGLYVSVMTDTNSFRYARTTPLAHQIAGEMIQKGVNPEAVYQAIYSSKQVSHLGLLGHLLQNVKVAASGKLAWFSMSLDLRTKYQVASDDTQSFLNLLLLLQDTEVVCFFREEPDQETRLSMRSKGRFPIHQLAMNLGGGGHEFAAGASLHGPMENMIDQVVSDLEILLKTAPPAR